MHHSTPCTSFTINPSNIHPFRFICHLSIHSLWIDPSQLSTYFLSATHPCFHNSFTHLASTIHHLLSAIHPLFIDSLGIHQSINLVSTSIHSLSIYILVICPSLNQLLLHKCIHHSPSSIYPPPSTSLYHASDTYATVIYTPIHITHTHVLPLHPSFIH